MVSLEMTKSLRSLGLVKFFSNSAGLTQKCICSQCGGVCECVVGRDWGGAGGFVAGQVQVLGPGQPGPDHQVSQRPMASCEHKCSNLRHSDSIGAPGKKKKKRTWHRYGARTSGPALEAPYSVDV